MRACASAWARRRARAPLPFPGTRPWRGCSAIIAPYWERLREDCRRLRVLFADGRWCTPLYQPETRAGGEVRPPVDRHRAWRGNPHGKGAWRRHRLDQKPAPALRSQLPDVLEREPGVEGAGRTAARSGGRLLTLARRLAGGALARQGGEGLLH